MNSNIDEKTLRFIIDTLRGTEAEYHTVNTHEEARKLTANDPAGTAWNIGDKYCPIPCAEVTYEWRAANALRYRSRARSGAPDMVVQWTPTRSCWTVTEQVRTPGDRFLRNIRLAEFTVGIPTPQEIGAALTLAMEFVETTQTLRNRPHLGIT